MRENTQLILTLRDENEKAKTILLVVNEQRRGHET